MKKITSLLYDNRLTVCVVLSIFLLFVVKQYIEHIYFINFVDEEDNLLLGKYILEGSTLYKDYFVQHQPIVPFVSAVIQYLAKPDNILLLIKWHRIFMIVWSIMWAIILAYRFRWIVVVPIIFFELTKILLFGNLFLAESIAIYPLLYVIAFVLLEKNYKKTELVFIGFILSFLFYDLVPLWPFIIFMYGYLLVQLKRNFFYVAIPFIITSGFCLIFSSFTGYIHDTIFINYRYYLPLTKDWSGQFAPLQAFFAPLLAIFNSKDSHMLWLVKTVSIIYIFSTLILVRFKKYNLVILAFIILGLTSLRYVEPYQELYAGFHMLPWYAVLILLSFILLTKLSEYINLKKFIPVLSVLMILFAIFHTQTILFDRRDKAADFHIHYSEKVDYARALTIMKKPGETLFIVPIEELLYWSSGIEPFNRYLFFYPWMENVPQFSTDVKTKFSQTGPTFIWHDTSKSIISPYLSGYEVLLKGGKKTPLFVKKDKIKRLDSKQLNDLRLQQLSFN